jgi:hypothetical protein
MNHDNQSATGEIINSGYGFLPRNLDAQINAAIQMRDALKFLLFPAETLCKVFLSRQRRFR